MAIELNQKINASNLNQLIDDILIETNARSNPYFTSLRQNEFSKQDFTETQIQFYFAVEFFSRPLAALAAKIPTPDLRMEVVRNVWEEHGEGELSRFHSNTFTEFLARLDNISKEEVAQRVLWPEVRIFNTSLIGTCVLDDYLIGAGMLGMIERMFCDISSWIGHSVVNNGWLSQEQLIHYNLHEELDIKHAQDFFDVLAPAWQDDNKRYLIEQGLRMGATVFNDFYTGLYRSRERRWMCANNADQQSASESSAT